MSCVNISTLMETDHLSPRERQIMDALLILGEATARGIQDALPDPLANATVRTMLRILETKGEVQHHEDGRRFVYRPVRSRKSMARTAMKRMVDVFYEDSVTQNRQRAITIARYPDERRGMGRTLRSFERCPPTPI